MEEHRRPLSWGRKRWDRLQFKELEEFRFVLPKQGMQIMLQLLM
jgi:hypothetical protein